MSYDDAPEREAAFFTDEPPASFSAAPPLIVGAGGPFDIVQARLRAVESHGRSLYILRDTTTENRIAMGGMKEFVHQMVIVCMWSISVAHLETDQTAFDAAITAVLTRIRGPLGDKTHGGAFFEVGESGPVRVEPQNLIANLEAGNQLETHIKYQATDTFAA